MNNAKYTQKIENFFHICWAGKAFMSSYLEPLLTSFFYLPLTNCHFNKCQIVCVCRPFHSQYTSFTAAGGGGEGAKAYWGLQVCGMLMVIVCLICDRKLWHFIALQTSKLVTNP